MINEVLNSCIEIKQHCFWVDRNDNVVYNSENSKNNKRYDVELCDEKNLIHLHNNGYKIFIYKNPDSINGKWDKYRILRADFNWHNRLIFGNTENYIEEGDVIIHTPYRIVYLDKK